MDFNAWINRFWPINDLHSLTLWQLKNDDRYIYIYIYIYRERERGRERERERKPNSCRIVPLQIELSVIKIIKSDLIDVWLCKWMLINLHSSGNFFLLGLPTWKYKRNRSHLFRDIFSTNVFLPEIDISLLTQFTWPKSLWRFTFAKSQNPSP